MNSVQTAISKMKSVQLEMSSAWHQSKDPLPLKSSFDEAEDQCFEISDAKGKMNFIAMKCCSTVD